MMDAITPDYVLLGLLTVQPRHGYELIAVFQNADQLGRVWQMSVSQIYAVLKRLENLNWIDGVEKTSENAPRRTEYTLTRLGEAQFTLWLHEPHPSPSIRRVRVEFLSRLFLARALNVSTLEIVRCQRAACEAQRDLLRAERAHAAPGIAYIALDFEIGQLDAILDWIARVELFPRDESST